MSEPQGPAAPRRLNLEIPADLAAVYANFAIISHSPWEIFLDFAQILPNLPKARVRTRLVLTPTNAKMLLKALEENIEKFESQFGEIKLPPRPQTLADQLFSTIRQADDEGDVEPDKGPETHE
ncbi:MAG: DUF3467 domain-containing protein [Chloroflexi bacterium]|nr:DUF3467 domain-containing protein [Chloroflexota bacterium]